MKPVANCKIIYDKERAGDLFSWFWAKKLCFAETKFLPIEISGLHSFSSCTLSVSSNHDLLHHYRSFHQNIQQHADLNEIKFKQ